MSEEELIGAVRKALVAERLEVLDEVLRYVSWGISTRENDPERADWSPGKQYYIQREVKTLREVSVFLQMQQVAAGGRAGL